MRLIACFHSVGDVRLVWHTTCVLECSLGHVLLVDECFVTCAESVDPFVRSFVRSDGSMGEVWLKRRAEMSAVRGV